MYVMKRLSILAVFLFLVSVNCSTPFTNNLLPGTGFNVHDLWVFPNPITVHSVAHIRFLLDITANVTLNLTLDYNVVFQNETAVSVTGYDLCASNTTNQVCQLPLATDLEFSVDFPVPRIPRGDYQFNFTVKDQNGFVRVSISLPLTVVDPPTASSCSFTSQFQAVLEGNLLKEQPDISQWQINNTIQVGPIGPLPRPDYMQFVYGDFLDFLGSEDFLYSWMPLAGDIATKNYIWGLEGTITNYSNNGGSIYSVVTGNFHVGYYDPDANIDFGFTTDANAIVKGTFVLNAYYDSSLPQPIFNGTLNSTLSEQPTGWPYPTTFGRLKPFSFYSNSDGQFVVQGSKTYCVCSTAQCNPIFNTATGSANLVGPPASPVTHLQAGFIAAAAILAAVLIALAALLFLRRRRRNYHKEDGVFDITRKPEYGTVLVVDDIVQETRRRESEQNLLGGVARIRDNNASESPSQYSTSQISRSHSEDVTHSETDSQRDRNRSNSRTDSYTRSYSEDISRSESDSQGRKRDASYSGSSSPRSDSRSRSVSRTQSKSSISGTESESRDDSRSNSRSGSPSERSRSSSPNVRNTPPKRDAASSSDNSRVVSRTNSESSVGSRSAASRSRSDSNPTQTQSQSQSDSDSSGSENRSRVENRDRTASNSDQSRSEPTQSRTHTQTESQSESQNEHSDASRSSRSRTATNVTESESE